MYKPITSRIKRSPLLKYSPLKSDTDPKDPKATAGGSEKGEDKKIDVTETKEKDSVGAYRRACGGTNDGSTKTDPETGKAFKCTQAPKGEEPIEIETITTKKTVPGDLLNYDTTLWTKKENKKVLDPLEVRLQERAGIVANRKVNKYERQMSKYGEFDADGNFTANKNLTQREMRKLRQAKANREGAKAASANVQAGRETGMNIGDNFYGGQRQMDQGEQTREQQLAEAKRKALLELQKNSADQQNITTANSGQAGKAIDPDAPTAMNPSAFKMYAKSPATKKLQGAQNTLPQHLQDAIKAAPGKMKAPLKKGYFKK